MLLAIIILILSSLYYQPYIIILILSTLYYQPYIIIGILILSSLYYQHLCTIHLVCGNLRHTVTVKANI